MSQHFRAEVSPEILNKYFDKLEITLDEVPTRNIVNFWLFQITPNGE